MQVSVEHKNEFSRSSPWNDCIKSVKNAKYLDINAEQNLVNLSY